MKRKVIAKVRTVSLRYGFYSHLVKVKGSFDKFINKYRKVDEKPALSDMSGRYLLIDRQVLNDKPVWRKLNVQGDAKVILKSQVLYHQDEGSSKKCVLLVKGFDNDGQELG